MKKITRAAALLLAAVMLAAALAGCSGKGQSGKDPSSSSSSAPSGEPGYVYVAAFADLKTGDSGIDTGSFNTAVWSNGRIYLSGMKNQPSGTSGSGAGNTDAVASPGSLGETATATLSVPAIYSAKDDGTDFQELSGYTPPAVPEGQQGNASINSINVDADGNLWILENVYTYQFNLPADFNAQTDNQWNYVTGQNSLMTLRELDGTGKALASVDLSAALSSGDNQTYVNSMAIGGDGSIYLADGNGAVTVLDKTGAKLFTIAGTDQYVSTLLRLKDGTVAAVTGQGGVMYEGMRAAAAKESSGSGTKLQPIDTAAKALKDGTDLPANSYVYYAGSGDYDFYYGTQMDLYGYKLAGGESVKLFNWINIDVDNNYVNTVLPLADGRVLCFYNDWSGETGSSAQIVTLTKTDASTVAKKETLTFACMYLDGNLRGEIIKFNRASSKYHIDVKDYSEYNTDTDYTAGFTKLTTEILTGDMPDMISTDNMPIKLFASKGLLEDLYTHIDADTELGGRSALVPAIFKVLESDGKLYQIASSFSVVTVMGPKQLVGEKMGWTLADLYAALKQLPEGADVFSQGMTKDSVLQMSEYMNLDGLVDWKTGQCSFDGDYFKDSLKFTEFFPKTFDWNSVDYTNGYEDDITRMKAGKQLLQITYLSGFTDIQMYNAQMQGNASYVGFPTREGVGSAFTTSGGIAMSASCKDKEGAWSFMRTVLSKDYQEQYSWNFPTNQNVFDDKLKTAMTDDYFTDENGKQTKQAKMSIGSADGTTTDIYAMTQAEADQLMAIINATTRLQQYDEKLFKIISDECAAYFDGQKSLDDTAKGVQSRATLYINEQK